MSTIAPIAGKAAAPARGFWQRLARDLALVGSSTAACHALGVVTSLLLRTLLSPAQMGIWQGLKMFLSYSNYANLGVSKGAARELAIARGHGNLAAAERGLNLAFTVNVVSSVLFGVALAVGAVGYALYGQGPYTVAWSVGLAVLAVTVIIQRHVTFQVTILRAEQQFGLTSAIAMLEAALALIVGAVATWLWGLTGLYLSTIAVLIGSWIVLRATATRRLTWTWDRREASRLVGIGGPILLAGVVGTLFRSIDKLLILSLSADREYQLGCYGLALLVSSQLVGLATMLAVTLGPRFGELFGRSGRRASAAHLAARSSELMAALLAFVGGMAIVAGPALLGRMFADYREGLAPLAWVVVGAVLAGLSLPLSQYLTAVGRERIALAAVSMATLIAGLGCSWTLTHNGGLTGVAQAMALAQACYWLLLLAALWPELSDADRGRFAMSHVLALLPTLGLAWLLGASADHSELLSTTAIKVFLVAIVSLTTSLIGWRYGGWRDVWQGGEPR